jgi:RNase adapter protein RapZ
MDERPRSGGPDEYVVITGMSGAGRSEAAKVLEDLGYFVIDNLPPSLINRVADLAGRSGPTRVALVVDARGGGFTNAIDELAAELESLRNQGADVRVLYLEASDEVLVRRYEATRRRHPVPGTGVVESIGSERELLLELRGMADLVIDTSDLNVHELRQKVAAAFAAGGDAGLRLTVSSFGFKYGLPLDADMVVDVRFLPNPHWVPELRPRTGQDPEVREYVLGRKDTARFLERLKELLEVALPGFVTEGKQYLTVAVGCTGGKHRSVAIAEELAAWLRSSGFGVHLTHRDVDRE